MTTMKAPPKSSATQSQARTAADGRNQIGNAAPTRQSQQQDASDAAPADRQQSDQSESFTVSFDDWFKA